MVMRASHRSRPQGGLGSQRERHREILAPHAVHPGQVGDGARDT